jgi:hypothetical protein
VSVASVDDVTKKAIETTDSQALNERKEPHSSSPLSEDTPWLACFSGGMSMSQCDY